MKLVLLVVLLCVLVLTVSCGQEDAASLEDEGDAATVPATVFVIGNHSNAPAPNLDALKPIVEDLASRRGSMTIICADGDPVEVGEGFKTIGSEKGNSARRENDNRVIVEEKIHEMEETRAAVSEVDLLEAIRKAARSLMAAKETNPEIGELRIVVADSGLSTMGAVDFTKEFMLDVNPEQLAEYLGKQDYLVSLKDIKVECYFFGDVCEPQGKLTPGQVGQVKSIWKAIFEAGGASEVVFKSQNASSNYDRTGLPAVTEVSTKTDEECGSTVILRDSNLRFVDDKDEYFNQEDAENLLKKYAEFLKGASGSSVHIIGATASASPDGKDFVKSLSSKRADRVKETLISFGVDSSKITTEGLGDNDPEHVNDLDEQGCLIPDKAAQNRKVILEFSNIDCKDYKE